MVGCTTDTGCPAVIRAQTNQGATLASTHQHCCIAVGDKGKAREPPDKKAC
jgi:hypothetical protein